MGIKLAMLRWLELPSNVFCLQINIHNNIIRILLCQIHIDFLISLRP